ncbi:MAG TPA: hypothetical protein PLI53_12175 [Geobacteraceae bacterium]|nr:hypothetical protein [Geobacteraceae bacterium]
MACRIVMVASAMTLVGLHVTNHREIPGRSIPRSVLRDAAFD